MRCRVAQWASLFAVAGMLFMPENSFAVATAGDFAAFKRVTQLYGASRKAIERVEYDYSFDLNGNRRDCRYARSGDRVYHAGLWVLPGGGFSMPDEVAWDGQRVHHRSALHTLSIARDKRRLKTGCPTPEEAADECIGQALGLSPRNGQNYTLLATREVSTDQGPCVELEFDAPFVGGKLVCRHAQAYGYWPVYARLTRANGTTLYEMTEVRYSKVELDGNALFYPVLVVTVTPGSGLDQGNRSTYAVEEKSLHLNGPLDASRFAIKPWPSDRITDWDTGREAKAQDPNWSPKGHVGFPWDVVVRSLESAGHSPTIQTRATVGQIDGAKAPDADVQRTSSSSHSESAFTYLVLGGVVLTGASCYLLARRRFGT